MGPLGQKPARQDMSRESHQDILAALADAVATLTGCIERLDAVVAHAQGLLGAAVVPAPRLRAQVSFGGGASVLGRVSEQGRSGAGRDAPPVLVHDSDSHSARGSLLESRGQRSFDGGQRGRGSSARGAERPDPLAGRPPGGEAVTTSELMAVSELVHQGYSRDEIVRRLQARWGDRASAILHHALD